MGKWVCSSIDRRMVIYKTLGFLGVKERKPTQTHFLLIEKADNAVGTSVRYPALGKVTYCLGGRAFILSWRWKEKRRKKRLSLPKL